ncbi:MAG: serine/threonine-protein kinase, partial [Myxococcota bacterium]
MLVPHDYDRYRVVAGVLAAPDLSLAWAEVDGHKVELVTAPPVPSNARLTVLRRMAEREALAVDGAAPYLAGGVDERRTWLALGAVDGPSLHQLAEWVTARPQFGSGEIAARITTDLAATLREVVKRAPSLPVSGLGDVRVGTDGRLMLGHLGEVLPTRKLDERELVAELGGWLVRLAGQRIDGLEGMVERARAGTVRHLAGWMDELEARMDEWGGTPRGRVGAWARHLVDEHPPIAPPTLVDEYPGDTPFAYATPRAPTPHAAAPHAAAPHAATARAATPMRAPDPPRTPAPADVQRVDDGGTPMAGMVLGGKYRIVGRVANGMMGRIYEATRVDDYKRVAIKLMLPPQEDDLDVVVALQTRFRREAASLARLDHPNIVKVYDCGILPEVWLAMEFVDGPTLAKVLRTRPHLAVDDVLTIARRLCGALDHAHSHGVIHRDLKPANVILAGGEPSGVRLVDFGLAKDWDGQDLTNDGTLLGTPHYMSPEQCNGDPAVRESDIYALGMMLYRLLTGRMPFEGRKGVGILLAHTRDPVPRFDSLGLDFAVPPQLELVVRKCLEKKPENRYRTAAALDAALASCQDPTAAVAMEVLTQASWAPPRWLVPVAAVALGLFVLVGTASAAVLALMLTAGPGQGTDEGSVEAPAAHTDAREEAAPAPRP